MPTKAASSEGLQAVVAADAPSEYVFDFGKHSGKTLSMVWRTQPRYLCYLINQKGFLDTVLTLKQAMEAAGIMDEALRLAATMRAEGAAKVVANPVQAKRGARSAAAQPEAKRVKLSPLVAGVAEAIGQAKSLPKSCLAMLLAGLPGALETPAGERHEQQATLVDWVGEVLAEVHEERKSNLASAEEALAAVNRTKAELEGRTSEARAALLQQQEAVEAQQAELTSRSEAVQASKARLCEAHQAEAKFRASLAATRKERDALDGAVHCSIRSLKQAELFRAEEVAVHLSALTPMARRLALDDSLLLALPAACLCRPDLRSAFDDTVIDQLQAGLTRRAAELAEALDATRATADEHAAAVASAQEGVSEVSSAQQSAAAGLAKAQSEHCWAAEAVAAAEAAERAHASELGRATRTRDKEALALQNFVGYNMECFNTLCSKVAPATQVAQATQGGA